MVYDGVVEFVKKIKTDQRKKAVFKLIKNHYPEHFSNRYDPELDLFLNAVWSTAENNPSSMERIVNGHKLNGGEYSCIYPSPPSKGRLKSMCAEIRAYYKRNLY